MLHYALWAVTALCVAVGFYYGFWVDPPVKRFTKKEVDDYFRTNP